MRILHPFPTGDPDCRTARSAGRRAAGQLPRPPASMPPPQRAEAPPPGRAAERPPRRHRAEGRRRNRHSSPRSPPPAPYTALAVAPPKPYTDREPRGLPQGARSPSRRRRIAPRSPSWCSRRASSGSRKSGNAAGKKTGIEALATALSLAAKDGSGWETLSEFADDETAAPYPDRPNTVCSPAGPEFNAGGSGEARRDDQDRRRRLGLHVAPTDVEVRAAAQAERAGDREARHDLRARDARHGAERQPGLHARRRPRAARSGSWRPRRSTRSAPTSSATARTPPAPGRSSA